MMYERIKELAQQSGAVGLRLYADDGNKQAHATVRSASTASACMLCTAWCTHNPDRHMQYESMGMTSHYKVFESMF